MPHGFFALLLFLNTALVFSGIYQVYRSVRNRELDEDEDEK